MGLNFWHNADKEENDNTLGILVLLIFFALVLLIFGPTLGALIALLAFIILIVIFLLFID